MRNAVATIVSLVLILPALPLRAGSHEQAAPDPQVVAALEARANQAAPRDRCFLYAQLVHDMTELSLRHFAAGEVDAASELLRKIQSAAQKIHLSEAARDKRLKNAEILLNQTSFRLNELLHSGGSADRALVEQTIAQVNQAQNAAMMESSRSKNSWLPMNALAGIQPCRKTCEINGASAPASSPLHRVRPSSWSFSRACGSCSFLQSVSSRRPPTVLE